MKLLVTLYDKTLEWSKHEHAPRYLAAVSFIESSVFPIPPYFMLAPMALAKPSKAFYFAFLATLFSVLGGIVGYALGYFVFKPLVSPLLETFNWMTIYYDVLELFQEYGFWAILLTGFMPIPYKFVAIAAGFMQLALIPFIAASFIGRSFKFFLLALLIKLGGARMEQGIRLLLQKAGLFVMCLVASLFGLKLVGVI